MVGRFIGDVGDFYGEETFNGKKVLCRFVWSRPKSDSPQWEQAFSEVAGRLGRQTGLWSSRDDSDISRVSEDNGIQSEFFGQKNHS
jgi:hypothetical protein